MNFIYYCLIGISLSMDTFSLSLSLGNFNIKKKPAIVFSVLVGIFHFFMPLLGSIFGILINKYLFINPNVLLGLIFTLLSLEMFFSKDAEEYNLGILSMILYAFSVSLDSFTVGIGLSAGNINIIIPAIIFACISSIFTLTGILIGKYSHKKLGKYSKVLGLIIITLLAIIHFLKA